MFGNGRTAVKFSIGKYLEAPNPPTFTRVANPAGGLVQSATRTWTDRNNDFVPQASELGALNPTNFGTTVVSSRYADDVLTNRMSNWELAAQVQHEIYPRMSVNVGYFRRWYDNLRVTDNLSITPADYSPYSVKAPLDPRLPDGGGYTVTGLYDANRLVSQNNVISLASKFGTATELFNGVDLTVNARLPKGIIVSGGPSWGRYGKQLLLRRGLAAGHGPAAGPGRHQRGRPPLLRRQAAVPAEREADRRLPAAVAGHPARGDVPEPAGTADHRRTGPTPTPRSQPRSAGRSRRAPPARRWCRSFSRARCTTSGCTSSTSARRRFSGSASSACRRTWTSTTRATPAPSCRTT